MKVFYPLLFCFCCWLVLMNKTCWMNSLKARSVPQVIPYIFSFQTVLYNKGIRPIFLTMLKKSVFVSFQGWDILQKYFTNTIFSFFKISCIVLNLIKKSILADQAKDAPRKKLKSQTYVRATTLEEFIEVERTDDDGVKSYKVEAKLEPFEILLPVKEIIKDKTHDLK